MYAFFKEKARQFYCHLKRWSIKLAVRQQNLLKICYQLSKLIPDVSEQYTSVKLDIYYCEKVRALHAFQIRYTLKNIGDYKNIVDIGDSSGNHLKYLKHFKPDLNCVSVNLDSRAVDKINAEGGKAVLCDAHKINEAGIKADAALSFEMVEHLDNPLEFLRNLKKIDIRKLIITVPYRRVSQVGLYQYRDGNIGFGIEDVHVFELCPYDWELLFKYSGWKLDNMKIFYQYPTYLPFLRYFWNWHDFEGFVGFTLVKP